MRRPVLASKRTLIFCIFTLSLALNFIRVSPAIAYTFTTIDYPGATTTECLGINDAGQIVGGYWDAGFAHHGFLRDEFGVFTSIDYPGATETWCFGINDAGHIVGLYEDAGGAEHGFLRDAFGGFTSIDYPGAIWTECFGINDAGQIVGGYWDAGFAGHGFVTCRCPEDIIYPTGCISGNVTESGTGVPLAGMLVKLERIYPRGPRRTVRTDYNGCYHFTDLEDGIYRIRVKKAGCRGERRRIIGISGGGQEVYNVNFKCR